MREDYLRGTRDAVCAEINTDNGRLAVVLIADGARKSLGELTDAQRDDLRARARSGDRFTEFLREEDDVLSDIEVLREDARELIRQLAIDFRRSVAWPSSDEQEALSGEEAAFGVTLLCDDEHSPGRNESEASWWSWFRGAVKFVGGIVTAGADAILAPLAIKPLSMRIGLGVVFRSSRIEARVFFSL